MANLTPDIDRKVVLGMALVLIIPTVLTHLTVVSPHDLNINSEDNPTPYGYTVSLLWFLIPMMTILWWFIRHESYHIQRYSFYWTIGLMIPLGFLLDLFLGGTFFTFPNSGATMQIYLPGYIIGEGWKNILPLEEFGFYTLGFVAILLIYIWCDEYWFGAYNVDDYENEDEHPDRIVVFHPASAIIGVLLILLAILYKKFGPHDYHEGFPGYFTFLVCVAFIPSCVMFKAAQQYINWRAYSFTFFFMLLISVIWEATLGLPYGWWAYKETQMIGSFIEGWSGLPIEEPFLWMVVSFTTVIVYEVVKIIHGMRKSRTLKQSLFG